MPTSGQLQPGRNPSPPPPNPASAISSVKRRVTPGPDGYPRGHIARRREGLFSLPEHLSESQAHIGDPEESSKNALFMIKLEVTGVRIREWFQLQSRSPLGCLSSSCCFLCQAQADFCECAGSVRVPRPSAQFGGKDTNHRADDDTGDQAFSLPVTPRSSPCSLMPKCLLCPRVSLSALA